MNIIFAATFLARDPRERENPTRIVTASGDVLDGVERSDIYGIFPSMLDAFRDQCNFHAIGHKKTFRLHDIYSLDDVGLYYCTSFTAYT